jgi:hypothetical protein
LPRYRHTTRRIAQTSILAILGLAVFAWGLQYKLSLYRPEANRNSVLAAKLFPPKERLVSSAQRQRTLCSGRPASLVGRQVYSSASAALPADSCAPPRLEYTQGMTPRSTPVEARSPYRNPRNPRGPPIAV